MKALILVLTLASSVVIRAQVGSNNINVPNTGVNTNPPPLNTYTPVTPMPSVPANSATPGATGTYSVDPAQPDLNNPNNKRPYTTSPNGTVTYSPQTTGPRENKK